MTAPTFSVVVCTDGRLAALRATLRALRALEGPTFELILVVGPTPDGTRAFAESLGGEAKVAYCPQRNLSQARNLGLALAAGEVVAFLDDDAVPEPEWLADLAAAYADPGAAAAGGIVYDPSGLEFQARYVTLDRLGYAQDWHVAPAPDLNYPFSARFPHLLGANCSFRREVLLRLGGFDECYEYFLDESDVLARLNDAGGQIVQCPRAAVHHKFAASADRDARRVVRHWRPLLKNRIYFGLRNGAGHHSPFDVLRAALEDGEQWRRSVVDAVARGDLPQGDLERFEAEALDAFAAGLAAARAPRRLGPTAADPPPFRPFAPLVPEGGRLGLCLVSQDYPPGHNGGIARNTAELAAAWAQLGHDVHVFTRARGAPSLDYEDGVWVHRLAVTPAGAPPRPPGLREDVPQDIWDLSRSLCAGVEALAARRRVDLVYAPLWDVEPFAFLVAPRFPLVVALQTTMAFWLDSQAEKRRDAAWIRARGGPLLALERWCLTQAPLLHANSRAIVEDIALRYDLTFETDRLLYAPHGLADAPPPPAAPGPPGVRFTFVGRLERRKGIDVLLNAAPSVLRALPQARLDIVGDDALPSPGGMTYHAAFLARDDVADVRARISFHGRLEEAELLAHLNACDVLVAPSRYESFGLVYVEGLRAGKAVIAGSGGGGGEVVEAGVSGLLVPPGDVAALAAAMTKLGEDSALRREMGAAGRARYEERFTARAAADALLAQIRAKTPAG